MAVCSNMVNGPEPWLPFLVCSSVRIHANTADGLPFERLS